MPLGLLYNEETRRNEEKDYLDKMFDYVLDNDVIIGSFEEILAERKACHQCCWYSIFHKSYSDAGDFTNYSYIDTYLYKGASSISMRRVRL